MATPKQVSSEFVQLMPHIVRGIALDFFVKRGITQTQFLVLIAVLAYGRCPMGMLAKNMQVRMPTATGIVDRLVQSGMLRRFSDSEDRRKVWVELTPKGVTFVENFRAVLRRRWEAILSSLEPGELESFQRVIRKLRWHLELA